MKPQTKFKETEIGMIPEDWKITTLEHASQLLTDGSHFSPKEESIGTYFIATVKDMEDYSINISNCKRISENVFKELSKSNCRPRKGDVLFSKDGTMGLCFVFNQDEPIVILSSIALIRPNNDFDSFFLKYSLSGKNIREFIIAGFSSGSALPRLTLVNIKKIPVLKPPLSEQRSIAKILSDLDNKIELLQSQNKTLEAIGQALFKRWFVEFEFPNEKGKPYKSSGGKMIDSELGEIPKSWRVGTVSDCGRVVCGKTPPTGDKENYGEDIQFITIPDMHNNLFIVKTERKLSLKGASTQSKKELPSLSICVSCIATPGLVSITTEKSHTNQQINSIICNKNISPYFMFYNMKYKSEDIKIRGLGGTATLNLNTGDFGKIKLSIPTDDIIKKFHDYMKPIFTKILINCKETESLREIRDALLPKLMSGKIRVPVKVRT